MWLIMYEKLVTVPENIGKRVKYFIIIVYLLLPAAGNEFAIYIKFLA